MTRQAPAIPSPAALWGASRKLDDAALRRATVYGSVMGSFAVEKLGLDRLRALKKREITARARHFHKMTPTSNRS